MLVVMSEGHRGQAAVYRCFTCDGIILTGQDSSPCHILPYHRASEVDESVISSATVVRFWNTHFCTIEYVNTSCIADVRCEVEV